MLTSRSGVFREGSTYKQLSFWITGGAPHALSRVALSPERWQDLYRESHLLKGARVENLNRGTAIMLPVGGPDRPVAVRFYEDYIPPSLGERPCNQPIHPRLKSKPRRWS